MSPTPHELAADFPALAPRIEELKAIDLYFAKLFTEYHAVSREIQRIETDIAQANDNVQAELRQRRRNLKHDLYARLQAGD